MTDINSLFWMSFEFVGLGSSQLKANFSIVVFGESGDCRRQSWRIVDGCKQLWGTMDGRGQSWIILDGLVDSLDVSETIVESGSSMVVQHGLYAALKSEMQWKRDGRR